MKGLKIAALSAIAVLFLGITAAQAAGTEKQDAKVAGVGLRWGVGITAFNDSRLSGVSQILDVNFQIEDDLTLFVHTEQIALAYDGEAAASVDGRALLNGIGILYRPGKYVKAGIGLGKADIDMGAASLQTTVPYAEVTVGADLLSGKGEKVAYCVDLGLKYRMIEIEDTALVAGEDLVENLNGMEVELGVGVLF